MPSIQKKIRDLERVLKKKGNAADTAALKARLEELQQANIQNVQSTKDKKLSVKYHMVKFVERKKLTRKIRNVDTKLKGVLNEKDRSALQAQRSSLLEDLTYVMYFPRSSKYIALFADNEDEKNTAKVADSAASSAARMAAYAARQIDLENGAVDRVQHAINVEYGLETEGFDPSKVAVKRARPAVSVTAPIKPPAPAQKQTQKPPAVPTYAAPNSVAAPTTSDSDSDSSSSDSDSSSSSSNENQQSAKKPRVDTSTAVSSATTTAATIAPVMDLDDFFLEEAVALPVGADVDKAEAKPATGGRPGRPVLGGKRAKGGNARSGTDKPLHKQEARLLKWQQDRKNRAHVPQHSLRGKRKGEAVPGTTDRDSTAGEPHGRNQQPLVRSQENDKRALWQRAGGLSAAAVTDSTIQRNKGAIVKPAGKKIVFE